MKDILEAILAGDAAATDWAALEVPDHYRGVTVHQDEIGMFEGRASRDKDPRESRHSMVRYCEPLLDTFLDGGGVAHQRLLVQERQDLVVRHAVCTPSV